ncbi:MAG: HipA family kinase [Terriglobales bacterium]
MSAEFLESSFARASAPRDGESIARQVVATAVQHVKRMRGGAQSHLMRCDDGCYYVVKFRNNPQHQRVLANEFLATQLARLVGLPVPVATLIDVPQWLVDHSEELTIVLGSHRFPVEAGLQFGSQFVVSPMHGQVFDYLPVAMLGRVRNLETFAGILALDKWTCNADGRQAAFWRKTSEKKYTAAFIDQGYCFNAGEWTFADSPLRGVYPCNEVYAKVSGWDSFEPWLSRIEALDENAIREAAGQIPPAWYGGAWGELEALVQRLIERKAIVRGLILTFRESHRLPFPKWMTEG